MNRLTADINPDKKVNPFALYDKPGQKEATEAIKKAIEDFANVVKKYDELGSMDTASWDDITDYVGQFRLMDVKPIPVNSPAIVSLYEKVLA